MNTAVGIRPVFFTLILTTALLLFAMLCRAASPVSSETQALSLTDMPQLNMQTVGCKQNIQIIATTSEGASLGHSIFNAFYEDNRLSALQICLQKPLWVAEHDMQCIYEYSTQRSRCNTALLREWLSTNALTHLVLIVNSGKAYTYQGIMYLDTQDDYDVFVHELAHFAGFMDEYALSESSAEQHCDPVKGINLIRENTDDTFVNDNLALWNAQGIDYVTSTSMTCENVGITTLKPSNQLTFMEYHDTANIPEIYLALWRHQIASGYQYNLMRRRLGLPSLTPVWLEAVTAD